MSVSLSRPLKYSMTAVLALITALVLIVLPPAARQVNTSAAPDPLVVKGALHVHTIRSDGGGTVDDVAAAAAAAGLAFVFMTDHGDGRAMAPPSYRAGVLVLEGAEIGTDQGHVLALGARAPAYPLAGDAGDVVEDVHRMGGLAIAAHPTSPKPELAWSAWDAPFDGLEWLNADSEWRDESVAALARLAAGYWFRPGQAVARTFDRPARALERADAEGAARAFVLVAGQDAHARIGKGSEDERSRWSLPLPSYRAVFETFALRASLDSPLTGRAEDDAAAVLRALRHGRVYTAIDALAVPRRFSFAIRSGTASAGVGDRIIPAGPLQIDAFADAPPGGRIVVFGAGREIAAADAPHLRAEIAAAPGPYRVEVHVDGAPGSPPVPWIVSSPIFVGLPPPSHEPAASGDSVVSTLTTADAASAWTVEHSPESSGVVAVTASDGSVQFTFALGTEASRSPYVAMARRVDVSAAAVLEFRIRADRPMRVSFQLRSPDGGGDGRRWRRSLYADSEDRLVRIPLSAFRPVPPETGPLAAATVDTLLVVVDTVNSDPGSDGSLVLADGRLLY